MGKYNTICLIPAAGGGTRVGEQLPKQYLNLNGMPIIRHSVLAFLNHPEVDAVCVVYNPQNKDLYNKAVGDLDILPPINGGVTRQESVKLGLEGLQQFSPKKILIHDAARPLVTQNIISRVINAIDEHKSVIPAIEVEDTLKKCANGKILHTVNRQDLMRAQTPQGFFYNDILQAHRKITGADITDDASINEHLGNEVAIVSGSQVNFKITTKEDIQRAESLMSSNHQTRTGTGFDVHKFCPAKSDKNTIMLCGIQVPHNKSLQGHSDSDVGLHAIVDALLGAICQGDIGEHFPSSNNDYKDMDSSKFLERAKNLVTEKQGQIINIDVTIICERPKLSEYKKEMVVRIAQILNIAQSRVSVKATTTEGLGFTGRGEGIAAQAVANVKVKDNG